MNGCIIPHTPIAVDFWKIRECPQVKIFFLTHLHGDHITGLTSSWRFPIYCSEITKRLLVHKLGIDESLIKILEIGCTKIVYLDDDQREQMSVTAIDAQHCPGAIMILMEGYFGTILHTGDFRYNLDMITDSILSKYSGKVDTLYLDNTYCTPGCKFPPREDAVKQIIDIIEKHPSYDILIAMRNLGKETLLCDIAFHFHEWISVSGKFYETLQIMGAPDVFDCSSTEHRIHVVPFHKVSNRFMEKVNEDQPTVAIIPTALYCGIDVTPYANNERVFVVPYSDHSSYSEIVEFVSFIKPGKIIPIVAAKARGPFGCSIENRADMSQFAKLTKGCKNSTIVIPASVHTFMNVGHSVGKNGMKRKRKTNLRPNVKKMKKGVTYESPDSKHPTDDCIVDQNELKVDPNACDTQKKEDTDYTDLNKCHKESDICDRSKKPGHNGATTTESNEIDTESFDAQFKAVKKSLDFRLPAFDKALGHKTYSRSLIKKKCDSNSVAHVCVEVDDSEAAKYARCMEYVNSLGTEFDVIEEVDIDWNGKSQRKRSKRCKKSEKTDTKNGDAGKITQNIDDKTSSSKVHIVKRKILKQKSISDFLPASAIEMNYNLHHCKDLILKTVDKAIVLVDSDNSEENGSEKYIATKVHEENGQHTIPSKSELVTKIFDLNDTEIDSEVDSDRLVIITDSEQISVADDYSMETTDKEVPKNTKKVVTSDLVTDGTSDEPDGVLVTIDSLEETEGQISMDELRNKKKNTSIIAQIGTQCPKHADFDELDLDPGSGLNDSVAIIRCDEKDVKNIQKRNNDQLVGRHDDIVPYNKMDTANYNVDRDEYHLGVDEKSNDSVNVNVGTQFVNETIEDNFGDEQSTGDGRELDNSEHEHSLSVINDSIEVIAGTQAFLNQSFNEGNEFVDADIAKEDENNGFNDSNEVHVRIKSNGDSQKGQVENQRSEEIPQDKILAGTIDYEAAMIMNDSKHGYRNESGQRAPSRSSAPNYESSRSKYFLNSNNSEDKFPKERDTSFNLPSLKFKPLKYKRRSGCENDFTSKTGEDVGSINYKPCDVLNDGNNANKSNGECMRSTNDELDAFIKAFKYFASIKAQKQRNGILEMEEKLREKAHQRYLAGVESGEYEKHSDCSFRIKPL